MFAHALIFPVIVAHLAFIAFVVTGGFLAWRRPSVFSLPVFPLHVLAVAWGAVSVLVGIDCPLTDVENWLRGAADIAPLPPTGFIDHYLTGVIYPDSAIRVIQLAALTAVLFSWAGLLSQRRRTAAPSQVH